MACCVPLYRYLGSIPPAYGTGTAHSAEIQRRHSKIVSLFYFTFATEKLNEQLNSALLVDLLATADPLTGPHGDGSVWLAVVPFLG